MSEGGIDVDALFTRYGPMVLRRCRRLLRDEDDALDVTQEVFLRVLRGRLQLSDRYPSSLLFRIATNLSLNRLRDRKRRPTLPADEVLERIAAHPDPDPDRPRLLDRLFARHPESSRTMAVLHYVDGVTLEQVARECGLSVSGVRKRLRRLRTTLKEEEGR
jgi:RNA polymerase sigma-70 factor (ECF subfamily)